MSKQRKATRFKIGDVLVYDNGIKWKKITHNKMKCVGVGNDCSFRIGYIATIDDDYDTWIASGFRLINFQRYLNEAEKI